eukprot:1383381-Amorphochlora_amoeboformis.AAC.1
MKSEVSKADSAAIAKQAQIDSMIENNKFMRKELDRRSQDTENCTQELVTVSRKNSNANSYVNKAVNLVNRSILVAFPHIFLPTDKETGSNRRQTSAATRTVCSSSEQACFKFGREDVTS